MEKAFSSLQRTQYLEQLESEPLDLLVIGGGITGAGIALDAQVRGFKTGLIEMQDFAAGTSSRSTKLVHGGLRYLKQFEIKLVAEVGKERAIVYENAPHVTTPIWMMLPFFTGGTFGKTSTSFGLKVYDFLAGVKREERRKMLNVENTLQREPLLRQDGLQGSGVYVEYRTDDARLTLEIMKEAVQRGVLAVNYTKADSFIYEKGNIVGVHAVDQISKKTRKIYAKKIVNASGPWGDTLREKDQSKKGKYLHLTKGVHIVIDGGRFPLKEAVYFDTPSKDGRMIFAIPREGKTYVGTTDTFYTEDLVHPRMTSEDRDYILAATNFMFPELNLTAKDVESSWAGLRPLIHEEGKDPSEISRKDEIFLSQSGLITIAGGKLTGYRKMAEKVVDLVAKQLQEEGGKTYPACSTDRVVLSGGYVGGSSKFPTFIKQQVTEGMKLGLSEKQAETLVQRYGSNIHQLYAILVRDVNKVKQSGLPLDVYAALLYSIEQEMAVTPTDFFLRRTGAILFDITGVYQWKEQVISCMAALQKWSKEEEYKYRQELEKQLHDAVVPVDQDEEFIAKSN